MIEQKVSEEGVWGGPKSTHKAEGAHAFSTTSWTSHSYFEKMGVVYFSKIRFEFKNIIDS